MGIDDDRLVYQNLIRFKPDEVTLNGWAVAAGVSRTVWADMRRHGNPSRRTLAKLLAAAGSSLAEFEALAVGIERGLDPMPSPPAIVSDARSVGWRGPVLAPLPLLWTALGGEWGAGDARIEMFELDPRKVIDRLVRPHSLAADSSAYAVTIVGESMWPRFRPGRRVIVSPIAPVAIGDDVVVRLRPHQCATATIHILVKELVGRAADVVELRQFTPAATARMRLSGIETLHKIIGEAY